MSKFKPFICLHESGNITFHFSEKYAMYLHIVNKNSAVSDKLLKVCDFDGKYTQERRSNKIFYKKI